MCGVWETLSQTPQQQQPCCAESTLPATLYQLSCLPEPGTTLHSSKITSCSSAITCSVLYSGSVVASCDSKLFLPPQLIEKGTTKPPCKRNLPRDYGCLGTQLPLRGEDARDNHASPQAEPPPHSTGSFTCFLSHGSLSNPCPALPSAERLRRPKPRRRVVYSSPSTG